MSLSQTERKRDRSISEAHRTPRVMLTNDYEENKNMPQWQRKKATVNYLSPPRPFEKLTSRKDGELGFWLGLAASQAMGLSAAELISSTSKQQDADFNARLSRENWIDSGFHRIFFRFSVATVSHSFNCIPESSAIVPTQTPQQLLHCHHDAWRGVSAVHNLPSCDSPCGRCAVIYSFSCFFVTKRIRKINE